METEQWVTVVWLRTGLFMQETVKKRKKRWNQKKKNNMI